MHAVLTMIEIWGKVLGPWEARMASCSRLTLAGTPPLPSKSPSWPRSVLGDDSGGLKNTGKGDPPRGWAFSSTRSWGMRRAQLVSALGAVAESGHMQEVNAHDSRRGHSK